jgi:hypothetical protein
MAENPFPGTRAGDDDWDQDAEMAAYLADIEAGRVREPDRWDVPGCTVSLGEAADMDLAVLEDPGLAEGSPGDGLAPGPVLAALTEQAAEELHPSPRTSARRPPDTRFTRTSLPGYRPCRNAATRAASPPVMRRPVPTAAR